MRKRKLFLSILLGIFLVHADFLAAPGGSKRNASQLRIGERMVARHLSEAFNVSLEAKENAEFILLPAHLVQESIATNSIVFPR